MMYLISDGTHLMVSVCFTSKPTHHTAPFVILEQRHAVSRQIRTAVMTDDFSLHVRGRTNAILERDRCSLIMGKDPAHDLSHIPYLTRLQHAFSANETLSHELGKSSEI